jgi:hypothetical protein
MANSRETETRAARTRKQSWTPPDVLPVPDAEPGSVYRWVRVGSRGQPDNRNISKRMREGWEPVNAKDHPELKIMQTERDATFQDGVEIGGLVLCKNSAENVQSRKDYYERHAQQQMASVDNNFMRENDPRMPLLKPERRSRVSFGSEE